MTHYLVQFLILAQRQRVWSHRSGSLRDRCWHADLQASGYWWSAHKMSTCKGVRKARLTKGKRCKRDLGWGGFQGSPNLKQGNQTFVLLSPLIIGCELFPKLLPLTDGNFWEDLGCAPLICNNLTSDHFSLVSFWLIDSINTLVSCPSKFSLQSHTLLSISIVSCQSDHTSFPYKFAICYQNSI